jgi:hypothetical protein
MTPRSFVYLAVAAALSLLFAVVSFASHNQWSSGKAGGDKLFPKLTSEASQIGTIEVRQGDKDVVLERKGGSWVLKNRGGYSADPVKVRTLLVRMAEADLIERKTTRPDRYAALELEDPAGKDAKSRLVKMAAGDGKVIGEVVLGKRRFDVLGTGKGGTYVRKPGDPQTWLASAEIEAPAAVRDWVSTSVFTADAGKISRVSIEIPGEEALRIEREQAPAKDSKDKDDKEAKDQPAPASQPKLQFAGFPPEGKKLKDAGAADGIARALASIDMEDVRKADASPAPDTLSTVTVTVTDGPTTTLRLRKDGDAYWLTLAATGEGEAAKKAADELNKRVQGWEFKVPGHKGDSILKKRADLLETTS